MKSKHDCSAANSLNQGPAFRVAIVPESGTWRLHQESRAMELDVASGEASAIGESMGDSQLAISLCPFCGEGLR